MSIELVKERFNNLPQSKTTDSVKIDKEIAQELLARNTKNRALRQNRVAQYAEEMRRGRWKTTGDTIRVSRTGNLLNGQHTLHGIVQSDSTFEYDIVWGLEDDAIHFMDTGAKRSLTQSLDLRGYPHARDLSSGVRIIWQVENGGVPNKWVTEPTYEEYHEYIEEHPEILTSVEIGRGVAKTFRAPSSPLTAAHYFCAQNDAHGADDFFTALGDMGAKLPPDSPVLALRKTMISWIARGSVSRLEQGSLYDVCMRAFDKYQRGGVQRTPFRLTKVPKAFRK